MSITPDGWRLQQELERLMRRRTDDQLRALTIAWARTWDEISLDLVAVLAELLVAGERLKAAELRRARRLQQALAIAAERIEALTAETQVLVSRDVRALVDAAGGAQASIIDSQLPPGAVDLVRLDAWSRVDARQIDAIVNRTTQRIVSQTRPLTHHAEQALRRELVRGVAVGANPRVTARRIVDRAGEGFAGGLSRALTVARTETLDAYRAAAALGQAQHADVLAGWMWLAELSSRTCPACLSQHGSVHPLSAAGPLGHQNCRCSRMPVTKPWSELGFPGLVEPPSLVPDADAFFAGLTPAEQQGILGKRGYQAWRAGRWPREQWAVRRSTKGWRDSFVVARAPQVPGAERFAVPDTTKPWQFGRGAKLLATGPRHALQAIQRLHEVPMLKDPVRILPMLGASPGEQGVFFPGSLTIRINPKAIGKALTTVHEFGHYLDFQDFGGARMLASRSSTAPEWSALRIAFDQTAEVQGLRRAAALGDEHAEYLARDVELFARGYAQWVTVRSGSKTLLRDLNRMRQLEDVDAFRQWSDASFEQVAQALDVIFASRLRS